MMNFIRWLDRRKEKKEMQSLVASVQQAKQLRERCIAYVQYLDADSASKMISMAEEVMEYIENGL
jgi:hypothetical protein